MLDNQQKRELYHKKLQELESSRDKKIFVALVRAFECSEFSNVSVEEFMKRNLISKDEPAYKVLCDFLEILVCSEVAADFPSDSEEVMNSGMV